MMQSATTVAVRPTLRKDLPYPKSLTAWYRLIGQTPGQISRRRCAPLNVAMVDTAGKWP